MYVILNDELYHHGIKGQRWGVRRFQNADGSLTSAGRQRYTTDSKGRIQDNNSPMNQLNRNTTKPKVSKLKNALNSKLNDSTVKG